MFAEVARSSSFTTAATRLAVSRASVTKHVAWLERSLGAQLLKRTTKQVGLTDAGLRVLENGLRLLERYEEMGADVRDANAEPRGVIRVGTPPSFGTHQAGRLVRVLPSYVPALLDVFAIYSSRRNLPNRVQIFLQYLKE